jgi:hypothetical protein
VIWNVSVDFKRMQLHVLIVSYDAQGNPIETKELFAEQGPASVPRSRSLRRDVRTEARSLRHLARYPSGGCRVWDLEACT